MVNQVRNRYTLVDIDYALCPKPSLADTRTEKLFAFSSCLLAKSMNAVLGRPLGTPFEPGDVTTSEDASGLGGHHKLPRFPGRVTILNADRADMGGHRFTLLEKNLIVAEADLQVREDLSGNATAPDLGGPYEFESLYVDLDRAHEHIRFYVNVPL